MKILIVLICGLVLISAASVKKGRGNRGNYEHLKDKYNDKCNSTSYEAWKLKYSKTFSDAREKRAFKNYINKCKMCAEQNEKYEKGESTFSCRLYGYAHLNETELFEIRGGLDVSK
jgi:hypothetical protein